MNQEVLIQTIDTQYKEFLERFKDGFTRVKINPGSYIFNVRRGSALFPVIMKSCFHKVRRAVEAYSNSVDLQYDPNNLVAFNAMDRINYLKKGFMFKVICVDKEGKEHRFDIVAAK